MAGVPKQNKTVMRFSDYRPLGLIFACDSSSNVSIMEISELQSRLQIFAEERDWDQFHSLKNLVLALVGEVGELAELLQWVDDSKIGEFLDSGGRVRLGDEVVDILLYLLRFADKAGLDINAAVISKLKLNAEKYPIEKSKGSAKKYNELG